MATSDYTDGASHRGDGESHPLMWKIPGVKTIDRGKSGEGDSSEKASRESGQIISGERPDLYIVSREGAINLK